MLTLTEQAHMNREMNSRAYKVFKEAQDRINKEKADKNENRTV